MNKKILKFVAGALLALLIAFAGLAIFVSTLDADKYRPQLVSEITKVTGRAAKLNGPIAFSLGVKGVRVSIQDASIANPAWASRPNMAGMGKFELSVGLLPLLAHRLQVNELSIENADILLETNAAGQHNWDFAASGKDVTTSTGNQTTSQSSEASLSIEKLSIVNSQLAMRASEGKISSSNVSKLTLTMKGAGADLVFQGDINGTPLVLNLKTGITDLLSKAKFKFEADATYSTLHLVTKGDADVEHGTANLASYQLSSGKTSIQGVANMSWNGQRPSLHGTMTSDHLDLADFKTSQAASSGDKNVAKQEVTPQGRRMFSDVPLPLGALKSADAQLDLTVGELPLGKGMLKQISAKIVLANGLLTLNPMKATIGTSPVAIQLKLDAGRSPATMEISVLGNGVDLGELQKLSSMSPFMTGNASATIQLSGSGASAHDIASSLNGTIVVTAEKGEILTGAASSVSSALGTIFNPKGGNAALNCLAARFNAKSGVLTDNGILIDSAPSTVAGAGTINLAEETIALTLRAKTKLVDVGGLVPAVKVSGDLSDPHYSVDAVSIVKNVLGSLASGNIDVAASTVPEIQTAAAGQNACVYTLDHPKAASSSPASLPADAGKATQKIQNLGNSVMKGLFSK